MRLQKESEFAIISANSIRIPLAFASFRMSAGSSDFKKVNSLMVRGIDWSNRGQENWFVSPYRNRSV